ncbi:hypothetical protein OVA03_13990 [Asticcacaulis sp. SL142]|uniref:hypothetical protein n=1 Tax=Asticcacaulis sp. SL142 TaxID=2995155 RepID=UPI00226C6D7C|nr:hypothetical protein [Asticcacaulis sp. SL142]WAC47801.1 hypothetical protein OVA03_13990 [Asticcacaulis sp. SL142]
MLTYNANYQVTQSTDDKGRITKFTRNTKGQVTQTIEGFGTPSARTTNTTWSTVFDLPTQVIQTLGVASTNPTQLAYDKVSNLKQTVDGRGKTWQNSFDPLNRIIEAANPDSETVKYG